MESPRREATWLGDSKLKVADGKERIVLIPQPSDDPRDPLNWSRAKKYRTLFVLCYAGFAALALPSTHQLTYVIQAPTYNKTAIDLSYSITACVAGLVGGPLILAPLARVIGRSSLIFWSLVGGFACQIWAASMTGRGDYISFMMSRVISGMFASIPTLLGPAYAMDIFFLHERGKAFTSFELSFLLGVNVAPTISGFIINSKPWPYAFWWTLAPCGVALILVFCFLEETGGYAKSNTRVYPDQPKNFIKNRIATFLPGNKIVPRATAREVLKLTAAPFIIGTTPITLFAGGYIFIVFAFVIMSNILLTMFLQTPEAQGGYGFTPLRNAYFTIVAWFAIAVAQLTGWLLGDRIPLWASRRAGHGIWHPEYRLWSLLVPGTCAPIGLGIFGAAVQHHLHYLVLALGFFLIVFSSMLAVPICLNYVVECFTASATEAAIAMNTWRLAFAISLGFFVFPWEARVGPGWLFGMAAFFDVFAGLMMVVLVWKGNVLRGISVNSMLATEEGEKITESLASSEQGSTSRDIERVQVEEASKAEAQ